MRSIRRFLLARGALARVAEVVREVGCSGEAFLLADETTYEVAGRAVHACLEEAGHGVTLQVLPAHPPATSDTLEQVRASFRPASFVVTCGSGTITDLGKMVATEHDIPLIAVATAPSMNGYASRIAALIMNGVEEALPFSPRAR